MRAFFAFFPATLLALTILLAGCSSDEKTSGDTSGAPSNTFNFNLSSTNENLALELRSRDDIAYPLGIDLGKDQIASPALLAIFPPNCDLCLPMLTHLNNLASRTSKLRIVVISTQHLDSEGYEDLLSSTKQNLKILTGKEALLFSLVDSLKRRLNIEIREATYPFLLMLDSEGKVISSYEGPVLEEMLEAEVKALLIQNPKDT